MYLKKMKNNKTGRTYLSIAQGYRDPKTGVSTSKTVKSLGYLEDLEKIYEDPVAHFSRVAKDMTEAYNEEGRLIAFAADPEEELSYDARDRKNFGYIAILKIYHELGLHDFFLNRQRNKGFSYNTNTIMQFLVISRLLAPYSKKRVFDDRDRYFERFDFSLRDIRDSLPHFAALANEAQRHINDRITKMYRGNGNEVPYYNVTNYYFELNEAERLKRRAGVKGVHSGPIVQMGLAMDAEGLPIAYKLYEGNENDISTLRPMLDELKREYGIRRVVIVADKGINSSDNIHCLKTDRNRDEYVVGFSARGGSKDFREYTLNAIGYRRKRNDATDPESDDYDFYSDFRIKSRRYSRTFEVLDREEITEERRINEKQVVFFSKQYAEKAKADRSEAVAKARDLVANPGAYNRDTSQSAARYVKDIRFDRETGAILTDCDRLPSFDVGKLVTDEKYDGYHAVVTSETHKTDEWVMNTYRNLRKTEEFFKRTRSDIGARPADILRDDHINAHFLICFIAFAIAGILRKKLGMRYPAAGIIECLKQIECCNEQENLYLFNYRCALSDALGEALDIDFTKKRMRLSDIKKAASAVKKQ